MKKIPKSLYRVLEREAGESHFFNNYLPVEFDVDSFSPTDVPYFLKYGFSVSDMYSQIYSRHNGIFSEKYISTDLYFSHIIPYLNNLFYTDAYVDKSAYDRLFFDVERPKTIIKSQNGYLYNSDGDVVTSEQACCILRESDDFIIKPSLSSTAENGAGCGRRIQKLNGRDFHSDNVLAELIGDVGKWGAVQTLLSKRLLNNIL